MRYWLLVSVFGLLSFNAQAEYRLNKDDMNSAVRQEFANQGLEDVEIEIFGGKTEYQFAQADDAKIMLNDFKIDENQGRFTAEAEIFADGNQADKTKLVGRYYLIAKAWVPARDITKDHLITDADLQEVKVRQTRLKNGAFSSKEDIVGKQATKLLKSGKIIEKNDLQEEIIIKKGQTVTAVYTKKGLQITSKMQALANASKGQAIKLLNLNSKKEVIGTAKESGWVEINNE